MIVADSNVMVAALAYKDPQRQLAVERLYGDVIHVPHLLDVEVVNVLRRMTIIERAITHERAQAALLDLAELPLIRYPHGGLLPRAWELRNNVTGYDAMYVALAETLDAVLVTADGRLAKAPGLRCDVDLLTDEDAD